MMFWSRPRRAAHFELGRRGEARAAWFYRFRGFRVVARNLRAPGGEIDLVVRRGRLVAFVEVKTRGPSAVGEGFEAVDRGKRERMIAMADRWIASQGERDFMIRYDIVSLQWDGGRFVLTHFPDAFRPVSDPRRPWRWRA
jgi:putative endonuclease